MYKLRRESSSGCYSFKMEQSLYHKNVQISQNKVNLFYENSSIFKTKTKTYTIYVHNSSHLSYQVHNTTSND